MMDGLEPQACKRCFKIECAANLSNCMFCDTVEMCIRCLRRHEWGSHTAEEKAAFIAEVLAG